MFSKALRMSLCLCLLFALEAGAATVTSGSDSVNGSLRAVVGQASENETITFANGLSSITINSGDITSSKKGLKFTGNPNPYNPYTFDITSAIQAALAGNLAYPSGTAQPELRFLREDTLALQGSGYNFQNLTLGRERSSLKATLNTTGDIQALENIYSQKISTYQSVEFEKGEDRKINDPAPTENTKETKSWNVRPKSSVHTERYGYGSSVSTGGGIGSISGVFFDQGANRLYLRGTVQAGDISIHAIETTPSKNLDMVFTGTAKSMLTLEALGGVVYAGGSVTSITNSAFTANESFVEGGTLQGAKQSAHLYARVNPGDDQKLTTKLYYTGTVAVEETLRAKGGAVYSGASIYSVENAVFSGNKTVTHGSELLGGYLDIQRFEALAEEGGTFRCTANLDADVDVAVNAQSTQESMGGALYAATGMGVVTGSAFLKNLVEAKGGEIKAGTLSAGTGSQSYYASLSTIGEGLQTTFSPSHSITSKTSITAAGGAIYANGHLAGLTSSLFQENAVSIEGASISGGKMDIQTMAGAGYNDAMYFNPTFELTVKELHTALGGAVYAQSIGDITKVKALKNTITIIGKKMSGGDVPVELLHACKDKLTLEGNYEAHAHGGGVYADSVANVTDSEMAGNVISITGDHITLGKADRQARYHYSVEPEWPKGTLTSHVQYTVRAGGGGLSAKDALNTLRESNILENTVTLKNSNLLGGSINSAFDPVNDSPLSYDYDKDEFIYKKNYYFYPEIMGNLEFDVLLAGGGVEAGSIAAIKDVKVIGNKLAMSGGSLAGGTFNSNVASSDNKIKLYLDHETRTSVDVDGLGGGIYGEGAIQQVSDLTLTNNKINLTGPEVKSTVTSMNGEIKGDGSSVFYNSDSQTVVSLTAGGGGLHAARIGNISGLNAEANSAQAVGGKITASYFSGNVRLNSNNDAHEGDYSDFQVNSDSSVINRTYARGGAVNSSVSLAGISSDSSFTNNEAKASSGIITGVAGKNDLVLKGDIDFLTVGAKDKSIRAEVHNNVTAAGGAIAASALGQVSGVFTDNMAIAESGAITGQEINVTYELTKKESSGITIASTDIVNAVLAKGGAISADGQIDVISGATFTDNSAQASTGDITGGKNAIKVTGNNKEASGYSLTVSAGITSSARAEGGAVHTASLELIKDSAFTGNKAAITAVGNIAKGNNDSSSVSGFRDENYSEKTFFTRPTYEARGGAVSVSNFTTMRIENSIFEGNSAQAAFDYGLAKGGALYLDVGATAGFKVLTLAADAGKKLIFRDNFQHDNQDTKEIPNDIYFGSEKGGHSNSVYVDIVGQGDVQILGGVQAGPKAAEELFIRTTGNLYLAGVNSADRLTVYTYNGGKLNLQTGVVFENPDTTSIVVTDKGELIVDDSFTLAAGKTLALSVGEVRVEAKGRLVINDGYSLNISGVKTGLFRDAALDVGLSNVTALRVGGRPFVFNGSNTINIQDASYITDTMQTYTIIDGLQQGGYYSFDSVTIENKALEALRYDVLQSYEYNAGKLLLAVKQGTNQNVFFTGSGKAKWNETDLNWKNSVNNSKIFINHDNVIFNSGAAGVAVDAGGVTVSGMLVADGVFSFSGGDIKGVTTGHTGSITASGKLMLTGGQADFYNRLDFSNGIFIDDGTLSLKQSGTIAAGNAVTVNSDGIFALESTSSKNFANTVTGSGNLDKTGSGVLNINGGLSGFTGALSVLDGSMILNGADIAAVRSLAVAAGKRLELNNIGTLSARLSGSGAIDKTGANTLSISERAFDGFTGAFSVKDGKVDIKGNQILSASLDTGGKELTFNPASGEFQRFAGGSVAGSGTVLKTGDGALFFTNNALSGFNGTVDHQQGVMEISGNLGASIESQTGSSLWLIGQTKTIGGDATLRGQVYTHGALTIKGKALLDGTLNITSLHKDITTLKAKDSATLSDTSTINLLEFSEGKYELISSDTSLVGSLAAPGITVGNRDISGNPRYSVNVKQEGKALVAELSSSDNEYLLWQGQSSSDWNGYNWVVQGGNDAISYIFNDYVSFDNTAGGRNVALNGAMAAVYGMTVDGNNYVFSNGVIEGTANKKGDNLRAVDHKRGLHLKSGRTTFSNTGIYFSQGLNIENGAAAVFTGASYLHKTGDSSLATAIRNNGVLELDLTSGYEFSNTMSGSGNFVKKGAAKLFLLGDISGFSGLMSVENGAIVSQSSNDFNPAMRIDLAAAGELALNSNVRSVLANRLTGAGKLTKLRSAELTVNGDLSGFTGLFSIQEGGANLTNMSLINAASTIDVAERSFVNLQSASPVDFKAALKGKGLLIKSGAGAVTLAGGFADFSGKVALREGTLTLSGSDSKNISGFAISKNTALELNASVNSSITGPIVGLGVIKKLGNTNLAITGNANLFAGQFIAAGGKTSISGENMFSGRAVIDIDNGAAFELLNGASFENTLRGKGTFIKKGPETLTLSSNLAAFTGSFDIFGGSLVLSERRILNREIAFNIGDGDTLAVESSGPVLFNSTVRGTNANFIKDGAGTLFVGGDFSQFDGLWEIKRGDAVIAYNAEMGMSDTSRFIQAADNTLFFGTRAQVGQKGLRATLVTADTIDIRGQLDLVTPNFAEIYAGAYAEVKIAEAGSRLFVNPDALGLQKSLFYTSLFTQRDKALYLGITPAGDNLLSKLGGSYNTRNMSKALDAYFMAGNIPAQDGEMKMVMDQVITSQNWGEAARLMTSLNPSILLGGTKLNAASAHNTRQTVRRLNRGFPNTSTILSQADAFNDSGVNDALTLVTGAGPDSSSSLGKYRIQLLTSRTFGKLRGESSDPDADEYSTHITLAADRQSQEMPLQLGLLVSIGRADLDWDAEHGRTKARGVEAGVYGRYGDWHSPLIVGGLLTVGVNKVETERRPLFEKISSDYHSPWLNAEVEASKPIKLGSMEITPGLDMGYLYSHTPGVTEKGKSDLRYHLDSNDYHSLEAGASLGLAYNFALFETATLRPFVVGRISHELLDTYVKTSTSFADYPAMNSFNSRSVNLDRTKYEVTAGIGVETGSNFHIQLIYNGNFQNRLDRHSVAANLSYSF